MERRAVCPIAAQLSAERGTVWRRQSDGALSFQLCFPWSAPVPECRARWAARRCWRQITLPVSKSERPSGDPSGLQRSSWPRSSGAPQRRCTTRASWAEPSYTATSAWSCAHWSLETAATSPCCWWTSKVGPGARPCSSRCTVSVLTQTLCPTPAHPTPERHLESWELGRAEF